MSVSYTGEPYRNEPISPYTPRENLRTEGLDRVERPIERPTFDRPAEEPFVPVYARRGKTARRGGGKIKTWMILAPIGVLVLGGAAAAMLMSEPEATGAPLAEPATPLPATTALSATTPVVAAPVAATPAPVEATPAAEPRRAAPVVRRASAPAPARRAAAAPSPAPVAARVATPATAPATATTSPTVTLNTAPTAPAATTTATSPSTPAQPPAPVIVVQPLG